MKLEEFIEENGTTMMHIAKKSGLSHPTIRHILQGRDMRFSVILKVRDATKGEVSFDDMIPQSYLNYVENEAIKKKAQEKKPKKKAKKNHN